MFVKTYYARTRYNKIIILWPHSVHVGVEGAVAQEGVEQAREAYLRGARGAT